MRSIVICRSIPLFEHNLASQRTWALIRSMAKRGPVDILPLTHPVLSHADPEIYYPARDTWFGLGKATLLELDYSQKLASNGINILRPAWPEPVFRPTDDLDLSPYLKNARYDLVLTEQFYEWEKYILQIRRYQPSAQMAVDSSELHFSKLQLQATFMKEKQTFLIDERHRRRAPDSNHEANAKQAQLQALHVAEYELAAYRKSDVVLVTSEEEKQALEERCPGLSILVIPHQASDHLDRPLVLHRRSGIGYWGDYGEEADWMAAILLKHEVAPFTDPTDLIRIAGIKPNREIINTAIFGIAAHKIRTSFAPVQSKEILNRSLATYVPVLFGTRGAALARESIARGAIPLISTRGASLAGLVPGKHCLVGDTSAQIISHWRRLKSDSKLTQQLQMSGRTFLREEQRGDSSVESIVTRWMGPAAERRNSKSRHRATPPAALVKPLKFKLPIAKNPLCSVILPVFNRWENTAACLESLQQTKNSSWELVLVDNGSTDSTYSWARRQKNIRFIRNAKNFGFIAAANEGMKSARGQNFLLLHNDAILPPHWLDSFLDHKSKIPGLGLMGPSMNSELSQAIAGVKYNGLTELNAYAESRWRLNRHAWEQSGRLTSACLFVPRETWQRIGSLDENFGWGYLEDDDYCLRALDAGLKVAIDRSVYVHHQGNVTWEIELWDKDRFFERSMAQFVAKWGSRGVSHLKEFHRDRLVRIQFNPSI